MSDPTLTQYPLTPQSVLGSLAMKAAPTLAPVIGGKAGEWTKELIAYAHDKLLPKLPAEMQGLVIAAMDSLKTNTPLIESTTAHGFTAIVTHLAMGANDEARLVWLASSAPLSSILDQLDQDSKDTRDNVKSREATWSAIENIALDFITAGGKAALPLLLSFVTV